MISISEDLTFGSQWTGRKGGRGGGVGNGPLEGDFAFKFFIFPFFVDSFL